MPVVCVFVCVRIEGRHVASFVCVPCMCEMMAQISCVVLGVCVLMAHMYVSVVCVCCVCVHCGPNMCQ